MNCSLKAIKKHCTLINMLKLLATRLFWCTEQQYTLQYQNGCNTLVCCCLGFRDPDLVNLLKYLLVIRKQYRSQLPSGTSESQLSASLTITKDFPGPLPEERSGNFPEKDVQVGFDRSRFKLSIQESVHSNIS